MNNPSDHPPLTSDMRDFDLHFDLYHDLMGVKVQEILLVSSPYDAYIMEEDGSLASKIIHEYRGLNLSRPPRLTWEPSAHKALELIDRKGFDLVITMPNLDDAEMDAFGLSLEIKKKQPDLPIILLAHSIRDIYPDATEDSCPYIENTFIWTGDSELFLALVKSVEDRMNVEKDTQNAGVRVLILVEDSPLYRSFFLPLIYKEVVRQTQNVLEESLNEDHRLLKMRARPKILIAENYNKAMALYHRYRPYVFGIISDTRFPKDCIMTDDAGVRLLSEIKKDIPHLPLLLMSSELKNQKKAEQLPAFFLDKNSPTLPRGIREFFLAYLGFGDFIFRLPDGKEIARASNLKALEEILPDIPEEPILYQARRHRFSNWMMARSEIGLASRLRRLTVSDFTDAAAIRQHIVSSIHALRKWRQEGVVAQFVSKDFDPDVSDFLKIGNGSLGGKARGLAFMAAHLRRSRDFREKFPDIAINIPKTLVISTQEFEEFITKNNLEHHSRKDATDEETTRRFFSARLPKHLENALESFLSRVRYPLAVRSSSLWEDLQFHPYSGLYTTDVIPNSHPELPVRLEQLMTAVKQVYASTFFQQPRTFSSSLSHQFQRDSMAVIIQQLVGSVYGGYYYPAISGVAQSHNFYPFSAIRSEDGVARIALGMGTGLKDDRMLRFCPLYPKILPQFSKVEEVLSNTQRFFHALKLRHSSDSLGLEKMNFIEKRDLDQAAGELPVAALSSTYDPEQHLIRDSGYLPGPKVLTFAAILKYDTLPLPRLLSDLLEIGRKAMGCPVEFEFAVDLTPDGNTKAVFSILQIKPMGAGEQDFDVQIDTGDVQNAFCYSTQSLGHGINAAISDIVYVKPNAFDTSETIRIASEISRLNGQLSKDRRPYLLAGPGRWGSDDRWLGIPVKWSDISGVMAIVEIRNAQLKADPSRGSHFFQKISTRGIHYLTVTEETTDFFDWEWIDSLPAEGETTFLRHVRVGRPFVLKNDGRTSRCVILKGRPA